MIRLKIGNHQICIRCVMDTSDKGIEFDEQGVCSHCHYFDRLIKPQILNKERRAFELQQIIKEIREKGKTRQYDCLIGISGGLDSSYVAWLAKKHELRCILVHFDNGWDSELAVKNIENIVNKTGFDYFNYVVNWDEFRELQKAYFLASVVDVEVPTDQAIFSLINKAAVKFKTKYILYGANIETESTIGRDWNFPGKSDRANLMDIFRKHGSGRLDSYPVVSPLEQLRFEIAKVRRVNLLLYEECNYSVIKKVLSEDFGWRDYGVKHGESTFTRFYQTVYLPKKFGIDKRKAHLSDQINSGHITRDEAIGVLEEKVYSSDLEESLERKYVLSKLGFSDEEFDEIMRAHPKSHYDFKYGSFEGNMSDRILSKILYAYRKLKIFGKDRKGSQKCPRK